MSAGATATRQSKWHRDIADPGFRGIGEGCRLEDEGSVLRVDRRAPSRFY